MTPEKERDNSHKDSIVEFLKSEIELFHNAIDVSLARVKIAGKLKILTIRSKPFRQYLTKTLYTLTGKVPQQNHIKSIMLLLELEALEGKEKEVFTRIGQHEGNIYIDLANSADEQIKITKEGWSVIKSSDSPVYFIRHAKMQPLPNPKRNGQISRLAEFLNLESVDHLYLVFAWLLMAMKPNGPYPHLCIQGEQGSGKSSVCKILRRIIDPSLPAVMSMPTNEENLLISALRNQVLAFDNISFISNTISDVLCRLATGGGFSKRTLFTDDEETCFNLMRPIILNGITGLNGRQDLCDRAIYINTVPIKSSRRRTEGDLQKAFDDAHPDILGGLCDALSTALRNIETVELPTLPRMADFAKWATAAESAFPIKPGSFMAAYERNRLEIIDESIDADPVASAVIAMIPYYAQWSGTASQLLETLNHFTTDEIKRLNLWPKQHNSLSRALKRSVTFLREKGIDISFVKSGIRTINIAYTAQLPHINPSDYKE